MTVIFVAVHAVRPSFCGQMCPYFVAHRVCLHVMLSACLFRSPATASGPQVRSTVGS